MKGKQNVKKKMLISFILDETGSMMSCKQQTVSGFNEYVQTLQKEKASKSALFTLTKFNSTKVEIVHDGVEIGKVALLTEATYSPNSNTPLYDAIGKTINSIKAGKGDSVLVVIQTDGQENDSREFTQRGIFDLITEKKKDGWTFVFMGADMDAYAVSGAIGISAGNTANYTSTQTQRTMNMVAQASVMYSRTGGEPTADFFNQPLPVAKKKGKVAR